MNTHHPSLKPTRHIDLNKYYPLINLLIQITLLLTLLLFLAHFQTLPIELYNMEMT